MKSSMRQLQQQKRKNSTIHHYHKKQEQEERYSMMKERQRLGVVYFQQVVLFSIFLITIIIRTTSVDATSTTITSQQENDTTTAIASLLSSSSSSTTTTTTTTKQRSLVSSSTSDDVERVIIHYKTSTGYNAIKDVAIKIYHEFTKEHTVVCDITKSSKRTLHNNYTITNDIGAIEPDSIWVEQGYVVKYIDIDYNTTTSSTRLEDLLSPEELNTLLYRPLSPLNTNASSQQHQQKQNHRRESRTSGSKIKTESRHLDEQIPYGIKMIQGDSVPFNTKNSNIMVCIVDTGVSNLHPDLNGNTINGINRGSSYIWNYDLRGHGTHIAGTLTAKPNNNYGVRGISNLIPLYVTRGLDNVGNARESDIVLAIQECDDVGAKIISLSLSGPTMSRTMRSLLDRLYKKNILIVAAAGNNGSKQGDYPASYNKVVSVSAVSSNENFWPISNYGPWIELSAPGDSVLSTTIVPSTDPTQTRFTQKFTLAVFSGTSMATPHVAGAAAIVWSYYPTCTVTQIRYVLAVTAKDKGSPGCDDYYGYGIVQIQAALNYLQQNSCLVMRIKKIGRSYGDGMCSLQ